MGWPRYDFVCPSPQTYPFQWLWDSAFHAIALLCVDPELAKQELRCLLQGAQPDGFIPHMLFWEKKFHPAALSEYSIVLANPFYTATVQPPVLARAVWRVYQATKDRDFLLEVLPPVMRFFRWLKAYRDPDDDQLIAIIQPDESGLDASPKYDVLMELGGIARRAGAAELIGRMKGLFSAYSAHREDPARLLALDVFNWEDVMVNTIYADGLQRLGGLCREAGYPVTEAAEFERRSRRVLAALEEKCWDERTGVFWDLYGYEEQRAHTLTFTSLFPLVLDSLDRIHGLAAGRGASAQRAGVLAAVSDPQRGGHRAELRSRAQYAPLPGGVRPWVNVNYYLYWGLRSHGYRDIASELAKRTVQMVGASGMREFYNPYTGEGQGAVDFGWSRLVLDLIHAEGWGCGCGREEKSAHLEPFSR